MYYDDLVNYGVLFLFRIKKDIQDIEKMGVTFSAIDKIHTFLKEVEDMGVELARTLNTTHCDPSPEFIKMAYENQPHFKMNMMFGMAISNLLYGDSVHVLNTYELISIRSICINAAVNRDCSVNSALVNALKIPVAEVPVEVMRISRSLDEYIKAVNFIEAKIAEIDEPDAYPALSIYRDHVRGRAHSIIVDANAAGFYGTYPEYVFVEMVILRKLSPNQYPSLYGTPSMPRWEVPYDQLQVIVQNAWRIRGGAGEKE